jgi:hypothetical protein
MTAMSIDPARSHGMDRRCSYEPGKGVMTALRHVRDGSGHEVAPLRPAARSQRHKRQFRGVSTAPNRNRYRLCNGSIRRKGPEFPGCDDVTVSRRAPAARWPGLSARHGVLCHGPPHFLSSAHASGNGKSAKIWNVIRRCYSLCIGFFETRGHIWRRMRNTRVFRLKMQNP